MFIKTDKLIGQIAIQNHYMSMDPFGAPLEDVWTFYVETPPSSLSSSYVSSDTTQSTEKLKPILGIPTYKAPPVPVVPQQPVRIDSRDISAPAEVESRAVEITNVSKSYTNDNIDEIVDPPSVIEYFEMEGTTLFIEFYDIRHAMAFKTLLSAHYVEVKYGIPRRLRVKSDVPVNLGTIVLLHLLPSVTNAQLLVIFSQFGEIRQIRGTPSKPTQRFIEYWDIRASQKAVEQMSGTVLCGSKLLIEFSMPGGMRKRVLLK